MNATKPLPMTHASDVFWLLRSHEPMNAHFPDEHLLDDVCSAVQQAHDAVWWWESP